MRTVWLPERFNGAAQCAMHPTKEGSVTTKPDESLQFNSREACQDWCDLSPSVWNPTEHVFVDPS